MSESQDKSEKEFGFWSIERRIKLTYQIAILGSAICVFYIIFDFYNEAYAYLPYYFILLVGSGLCMLLLKFGKVTLAKTILLTSGVLLLGVFAAWETAETGLFMYFLVVGVAAFTIFGTEEKSSAIAIGLFSTAVFYVVYFTDLIQLEEIELSESYISSSFFINFCVSLGALMTMIYHIMAISVKYERKMKKSNEEMVRLANDLSESKNRFELAIKGSSVGIWDWDVINDKLFLSPLLIDRLNYPAEKYVNMSSEKINRVVHPEDQSKVRAALAAHISDRQPYLLECRLRRGDNTYFWGLLSGQAEWNSQGKATRMVGTVVEIDDLKKAFELMENQNELLEKTNEELDRFVYSTSHDLKAPLSSILGLVKIAEQSESKKEINECLSMIENRAITLNKFIGEIIDYSRNTRLDVNVEEIVLAPLIDELISGLSYYEQSNKIQFLNEVGDIKVLSDKSRLKVILNNLLANAIKYHDVTAVKNPFVKVSLSTNQGSVSINVSDNGTGISEQYQERIFDMFYRASVTSEGSGLGLYIAKEMVTKIGGDLSVKSVLNEGSTFTLDLPNS